GTFQAVQTVAVGSQPLSVAMGDFDGDGALDLVVTNAGSNSVSVLLGDGGGGFFNFGDFTAGAGPYSVAVADFNGDGRSDLAVANIFGNSVTVLLGHADGTFQAAPTYVTGNEPVSVAVGDFNGDGIPDLAVLNSTGVHVLLRNGDGSFQTLPIGYVPGSYPWAAAVHDCNRDR